VTTSYPSLEDGSTRGPQHKTPCEICGEEINVRPTARNEWRLAPSHERGIHHQAYTVAEKRLAHGWWPLHGLLLREFVAGGISLPVEYEGVWCPGIRIDDRGKRYSSGSVRRDLAWILPSYAQWAVELLLEKGTAWSKMLRVLIERLERAAVRIERYREPWWIAWSLSLFSNLRRSSDDRGLGQLHKLTNNPSGLRRGDLTP